LYITSWSDFVHYNEHHNGMMNSARMRNTPVSCIAIIAAPIPPHSLQIVGKQNIHVILIGFTT
jgi:hypothetical protein